MTIGKASLSTKVRAATDELHGKKTCFITHADSFGSDKPVHLQSDQSLHFLYEVSMGPMFK